MPARKRAWLYVIRNTNRTALLFLLFTALMTLALLGTAMYCASGESIRALRSSIGGYIVIQTAAEGEENTDEALLQLIEKWPCRDNQLRQLSALVSVRIACLFKVLDAVANRASRRCRRFPRS